MLLTILQCINNISVVSKWGTLVAVSSLVILPLVRLRNFIVWNIKSSRYYSLLVLNVILSFYFFDVISYWKIISNFLKFFKIYSDKSWIQDTEYNLLGNSNSSFHIGADTFKSIIFVWLFYIFPYIVNAKVS